MDVGLYVRRLVDVEQPGASAAACNLLIRLEEALGLSLPGLQARKWQIGSQRPDLVSVTPLPNDPDPNGRVSPRDRLGYTGARGRLPMGPGAFQRPDHNDQPAPAGGEDD
jgi:hypothetical protein